MALIRISGLGATLLAGSALVLGFIGCDSGGTALSNPNGAGGEGNTTTTGGKAGTGTATGGRATTTTTGGSTSTGTVTCSSTPPTATGTLNVAAGYVTAGTLKGYGFTWKGDLSNATTCITPVCTTTGCLPAFGTSALCGAGIVTADSTYNSIAGIGMNLNQDSAGGAAASVAMGASITVTATVGTGMEYARIQLVSGTGASAVNYCVAAGSWQSGVPILAGSFNTKCWDTGLAGATPLAASTLITSVHLLFPSDATAAHPFSACLQGVSM